MCRVLGLGCRLEDLWFEVSGWKFRFLTLRLKIAQRLYITWSLGPKTLKCESLEPRVRVRRSGSFGRNIAWNLNGKDLEMRTHVLTIARVHKWELS